MFNKYDNALQMNPTYHTSPQPSANYSRAGLPYRQPASSPQHHPNYSRPVPQNYSRPVPPPPHPIARPVPVRQTSPPVMRPPVPFTDYGPSPFIVNIEDATLANDYYRQTLWTGPHMQSTLMTIPEGGDIGLEVHPDNDQFLRLEQGQGLVQMGPAENNLPMRQTVFANSAIFVPAGTWHNITNIGTEPMKLYVIYSPPHHPPGTVHATKKIAEQEGD
ncbi:MAG: cupin domain-containing protein [Defluviitaleaceae bacterium]|nr:cupin domain-containing protein [Defluviitaleaceae bacterium]